MKTVVNLRDKTSIQQALSDAETAELETVQAAWAAGATDRAWVTVRAKRNQLLADSDWHGMSDLTMSDGWTTYRQALRDVGGQADPSNITWPDAPA
jgi:hypothetical protein|tara:strand:+ start:691 stop:978 length:288 start_codon:yes stop_codon:yes gene_type:complete